MDAVEARCVVCGQRWKVRARGRTYSCRDCGGRVEAVEPSGTRSSLRAGSSQRRCPECGASLAGRRFRARYSAASLILFGVGGVVVLLVLTYMADHHPEVLGGGRRGGGVMLCAVPGMIIAWVAYKLPRTHTGSCDECGWHPRAGRARHRRR